MGFTTVHKQMPHFTEVPMLTRSSRSSTCHNSGMEEARVMLLLLLLLLASTSSSSSSSAAAAACGCLGADDIVMIQQKYGTSTNGLTVSS